MEQSQTSAQELETKATQLRDQGKGLEAIEVYKQAREVYSAAGNIARAAGCTHMIGLCYRIESDSEHALDAFHQAIHEYEKAGASLEVGRVYRDIGLAYEDTDQLDQAEDNLQKSKAVFLEVNEDSLMETSRDAELGITLVKIGVIALRKSTFEKAEESMMDGLALIRKAGHPLYESTGLLHLGSLYFATNHPGRMLANLEASLGVIYDNALQDNQTRRLAQIWGLMAHGYLACENPSLAQRYATKAFDTIASLSEAAQKPILKDIQAEKLKELQAV